jgi:hypothetical protein
MISITTTRNKSGSPTAADVQSFIVRRAASGELTAEASYVRELDGRQQLCHVQWTLSAAEKTDIAALIPSILAAIAADSN